MGEFNQTYIGNRVDGPVCTTLPTYDHRHPPETSSPGGMYAETSDPEFHKEAVFASYDCVQQVPNGYRIRYVTNQNAPVGDASRKVSLIEVFSPETHETNTDEVYINNVENMNDPSSYGMVMGFTSGYTDQQASWIFGPGSGLDSFVPIAGTIPDGVPHLPNPDDPEFVEKMNHRDWNHKSSYIPCVFGFYFRIKERSNPKIRISAVSICYSDSNGQRFILPCKFEADTEYWGVQATLKFLSDINCAYPITDSSTPKKDSLEDMFLKYGHTWFCTGFVLTISCPATYGNLRINRVYPIIGDQGVPVYHEAHALINDPRTTDFYDVLDIMDPNTPPPDGQLLWD